MRAFLFGLGCTLLPLQPLQASDFMDQFFDPTDGMFDASQFLASTVGFLPVPFVISEPAVGYGAGLALAFFHASDEAVPIDDPNAPLHLPPTISVVAYGETENHSQFAGGGHFGSYREDRIRYSGFTGWGSFNLTLYDGDTPYNFNIEGAALQQKLLLRTAIDGLFIGPKHSFQNSRSNFEILSNIPDITPDMFDSSTSGVGLALQYDTRDNVVSPNRGQLFKFEPEFYNEVFGGDFNYSQTLIASYSYWPLNPQFVLGLRLESMLSGGDAPFYDLPFIELRGIAAMRYQGNHTLMTELEGRWDLTPRWSLTGAFGSGWAADKLSRLLSDAGNKAGSLGVQYMIARRYNFRSGVEVSAGPDETVVAFSFGSAWN